MIRPLRSHLAKGFVFIAIIVYASLFFLYQKEDSFKYSPQPIFNFSRTYLDEDIRHCFFKGNNKSNDDRSPKSVSSSSNPSNKEKWYAGMRTVLEFLRVTQEFQIETALIEPSALFCILSPAQKRLLLQRNFSIPVESGSVITFGVLSRIIPILENASLLQRLGSDGFRVEFIDKPKENWMKSQYFTLYSDTSYRSHILCKKDEWTIHIVIFHERSNYLWHSDLPSKIPNGSGYFTNKDSAFERFDFISLEFAAPELANVSIPSNPQYFLFELRTSRFLECNSTVESAFLSAKHPENAEERASLSQANFKKLFLIALGQMKRRLGPFLIHFWIWSGTMLGWYRQCDIIPYTTDVDFAAWASEVDDLSKIISKFKDDADLYLHQRMGIVEKGLEFYLKCHSLRVDLFFMYPQSNGTWYAGHRPSKKYYFKYHHPSFDLCSAELLGEKVLVPCQTEEVITTEYGKNWMKPVTSWNYERSIWNRGPNINWTEEELKKVNADY